MSCCLPQPARVSICSRVSNIGEENLNLRYWISDLRFQISYPETRIMARKLAPDKWLFAATTGLALFGVVMVYSASAVIAPKENGNQFYYVLKQGAWVGIGFVVMLLAMQFNYQQLKSRRLVYVLLLLCTIGLISVFAFSSTNGAHRWIKLPGVSMQPSEMTKLSLIIFLAYFLEKRAGEEGDFWRTFVPCGVITGWLACLVVIEP